MMGIVFPLSWPGKVVLLLIAVVLAIIWSMLQFPMWWKKKIRGGEKSKFYKMMDNVDKKQKK